MMATRRRAWIAAVGARAALAIARSGWRTLPLSETSPRPGPGDRIVVILVRRVRPVATAIVFGTAVVHETSDGADLHIRHRVIAPKGHEPRLADIPVLVRRVGWTDERLQGLLGTVALMPAREFEAVDALLLKIAVAFGPAPKRKPHERPRTPGRRPLATARIASRSRSAR